MDKIRASLDKRLAAKGLAKKENDLFIRDLLRAVDDSPEMNLKSITRKLQLLGWQANHADFATIYLARACYEDGWARTKYNRFNRSIIYNFTESPK